MSFSDLYARLNTLPDVALHARVIGDGPPLIIMHGLFGSSRNWQAYARKLEDRAAVHLLDLRNHGESPWTETMDYPQMAEDLRAYMDRQDLPTANILGHSMGGKAAMQFALNHGERVRRLMVADIAPVAYRHDYSDYFAVMRASPLESSSRADIDQHLATVVDHPAIRAFLAQNLVRRGGVFAWRINLDAIQRSMASIMAAPAPVRDIRFAGPTLFLRGDQSDYVLPEHHRLIGGLFEDSRIVSLKQAGHWLHAEQPDGFIKAMTAFFKI